MKVLVCACVVVSLVSLIVAAPAASSTMLPTDIRLQGGGFAVPAPTPLEAQLIADAADGRLDTTDLLTASLIASGVADNDVAAVASQVRAAVAPARAQAQTQTSSLKRGDRLLRALHATVMRRYAEGQSRVDTIVATGEFNCLSSAVLFAVAAEGLLEAPRGMLSTTHAFVRATVDGKAVDVETTTQGGFAVDRRLLVTREFLRQRGVGEGLSEAALLYDLQHPEEVTLLGLVAALYSNRAVQALRRGDVEGAAAAFDRSTRLATGQLKVRVANWRAGLLNNAALGLLRDRKAAEARGLLLVGLDGATGDTRSGLVHNLASATIELANAARAAGRFRESLSWVDAALAGGGIDAATTSSLATMRAELEGKLAAGDASRCAAIAVVADRARCLGVAADTLLTDGKFEAALDVARAASALDDVAAAVHYNTLVAALQGAEAKTDCARVETLVRELVVVRRRIKDPPPLDAPRVMAGCSTRRGSAAAKAGKLDEAAAAFARAAVFLGDVPEVRHNRAVVELRLAEPHARDGRCDEARPHVRRAIEFSTGKDVAVEGVQLLEWCANERASTAAKQQQWSVAVDELRRGLRDAPDSHVLRDNLAVMLHNSAVDDLRAKRCDEARALMPELRDRHDTIVDDISRHCP